MRERPTCITPVKKKDTGIEISNGLHNELNFFFNPPWWPYYCVTPALTLNREWFSGLVSLVLAYAACTFCHNAITSFSFCRVLQGKAKSFSLGKETFGLSSSAMIIIRNSPGPCAAREVSRKKHEPALKLQQAFLSLPSPQSTFKGLRDVAMSSNGSCMKWTFRLKATALG